MSIKGVQLQPVIEECPYMENVVSISETLLIKEINNKDLEKLLNLGFRHFGEIFFRPMCKHCNRCISIRVPVQQFSPSKSVRRLFRQNQFFTVKIEKPKPSKETFRLYNQHKKRFKRQIHESYELYIKSFFHPYCFNHMLTIRDGSKLVAITHLDITDHTLSAVYCYYDENYSKYSPGKFSVYKEIEMAKAMKKQWFYPGYYVHGNLHTKYKLQFKPNQLMRGTGKWIDFMNSSGNIIHPYPFPD